MPASETLRRASLSCWGTGHPREAPTSCKIQFIYTDILYEILVLLSQSESGGALGSAESISNGHAAGRGAIPAEPWEKRETDWDLAFCRIHPEHSKVIQLLKWGLLLRGFPIFASPNLIFHWYSSLTPRRLHFQPLPRSLR